MSAVEWVSDTMRRYKGVSFPWRGIEDMEAQMAAIDRAEANKGGAIILGGDRLSHPDYSHELRAEKTRNERELTDLVVSLCDEGGWLCHHDRPAKTDKGWRTAIQGDAGMPDIIALRGDRLLVAELKHGRNKPTAEQELWLEAFRQVGAEVYVFRTGDEEAIREVLCPSHQA